MRKTRNRKAEEMSVFMVVPPQLDPGPQWRPMTLMWCYCGPPICNSAECDAPFSLRGHFIAWLE